MVLSKEGAGAEGWIDAGWEPTPTGVETGRANTSRDRPRVLRGEVELR